MSILTKLHIVIMNRMQKYDYIAAIVKCEFLNFAYNIVAANLFSNI